MFFPALTILTGPAIYEPKIGSPERKAQMDALRRLVVPKLKQTVQFQATWMRSNGTAAFLWGKPVRPDGGAVDYRKTIYAEALKEGAFDDNVYALWRKAKGKWVVNEWGIGATDVPWDGMWTRKGLPRGLFPKMGG